MEARRHPTIRDVATRAGVSKSLVSLALQGSSRVSETSREAILAAADELGYRPNASARNLGSARSRTIGIFLLDLHNPITADFVDAVRAEARARDYRTILVVGSDDAAAEYAELEKLLEFRVEGMIALGHRLPVRARRVISAGFPAIIVSSEHPRVPHLASIANDDVAGAQMAVDHLVGLGHRRIAHVTGGSNAVAQRRQAGYEAAMRRHRLARQIRCHVGAFSDVGGHAGMLDALSRRPRPTAVFVCSDFAAVGAMAAATQLGLRIPEDLSIIGYDGTNLSALPTLGLSTIAQPIAGMGTLATQLLAAHLDDGLPPPRSTLVEPQLVARSTTSAPPRPG
ncbi:MAG: LacI family transcriptional regulator [Actinomycetales bacterium]|nr:LacI family transcriptional regulator [Actinomycetales bacterium]